MPLPIDRKIPETNEGEATGRTQKPDRASQEQRSSTIEERLPGAKPEVDPKDLVPRVGGMPLEVPETLDEPKDRREEAILRRQQVLNRFNPAIGVVFETIAGYTQRRQRFRGNGGPDAGREVGTRLPSSASAALRTIELFASAEVDPFARAYLIAAGHAEAIDSKGSEAFGKAFFEIEEAAIQTTSLPYNLSVRGGRFFADWGYLGRRHAHDLPQIDVPPSVAQVFGQNRTDGFEVSWLAPTPMYLQFNAGWGFNFGQISEGPLSSFQQQVIQGNTVFGSFRTYYDLDPDHNVELGFSAVYAPQSRVPEAGELALLAVDEDDPIDRHVLDWDIHYRWYPLGRGLRQSLSIHGEVLYDFGQGRRDVFGDTVSQGAWSGYVYAEYRFSRQWRPGFRFDYRQLASEPALVLNSVSGEFGSTAGSSGDRTDIRTYSPYVTYYPSEFQRFILQYNRSDPDRASDNHQVLFQWEVVIGSHQHGFTERD